MRRRFTPGLFLIITASVLAILFIPKEESVIPAPEPPYPAPMVAAGTDEAFQQVVTAQELADHIGLPLMHPAGVGPIHEIGLDCLHINPAEPCDFRILYANGAYLRVITHRPDEPMDVGWQERVVAEDVRRVHKLVNVRGQLGVARGQSKGDAMDPDGWAGAIEWEDGEKNWLIVLVGPYDIPTLVSLVNGPWCTLATPAGVQPTVPFC